eukprot:1011873-Pyramimonas_sp.AAC.1
MTASGAKFFSRVPHAPKPDDCADRRRLLERLAEFRRARGCVTDPAFGHSEGALARFGGNARNPR